MSANSKQQTASNMGDGRWCEGMVVYRTTVVGFGLAYDTFLAPPIFKRLELFLACEARGRVPGIYIPVRML